MGEARRRGSRDQRTAEAIERRRLEEIAAHEARVAEWERHQAERRLHKFMRIKHRIETRHLPVAPPKRKPQHRRVLLNMALMAALGAQVF